MMRADARSWIAADLPPRPRVDDRLAVASSSRLGLGSAVAAAAWWRLARDRVAVRAGLLPDRAGVVADTARLDPGGC